MSCLYCNCPNEQICNEIYNKEIYKGFICVMCNDKVKFCIVCDKFHNKNEYINNVCIYELPFYKNLINSLKAAEILPSNYI
jgi:hypothetical protein